MQDAPCPIFKMSVNAASKIFGPVSGVMKTQFGGNTYNGSVGILDREKRKQHAPCPIVKTSVNRAATILGPVSLAIKK